MIALNSNTYDTSVKMLSDVSQIEFLLHALQVGLRGLLDLVDLSSSSSNLVLVTLTQAAVKYI